MYTRKRELTPRMLRERIAGIRARLNEPHGDGFAGFAECLSYDLENAQEKLARVEKGETVIEVFDSAIGRWQDA